MVRNGAHPLGDAANWPRPVLAHDSGDQRLFPYLADLADVFRVPATGNDNRLLPPEPGPALELDCLRGILAPALLKAAEARAEEVCVGADQVLLRWGVIDEDAYVRRLAAHLGLGVETFRSFSREDIVQPDAQLLTAARAGLLTLRDQHSLAGIVAPMQYTARRMVRARYANLSFKLRIRLATRKTLNGFLSQHAGDVIARNAIQGLTAYDPDLSAAPRTPAPRSWRERLRGIFCKTVLAAGFIVFPDIIFDAVTALSALGFVAFAALRLAASVTPRAGAPRLSRLDDSQLPVYSVIVALYREAASVDALMRSIEALDYPAEKLNLIFAVEPDDLETRAAIARLKASVDFQVAIAAFAGPRTKPKALNCALPFAKGSFIAVYDAEDRPEPGQLRDAIDAFRNHHDEVVCAQASLCIDNKIDTWLSRMFKAEYAGQFDLFLPGAATMEMPLPLGGSSNHFRTSALRRLHGWDAYNVTEDADLGVRLARFGYRSITFASTTFEEAPARLAGWMRQRTRWMKGWMQTWAVHMRSPRRLWRDAGPRAFITMNLIVGGNVLTALAHPVMIAELLFAAASFLSGRNPFPFDDGLVQLHLVAIASGYLSTILIGAAGLVRRGMTRSIWILLLTPLYWIVLSIAAWRALYQFIVDPYRWEKTEHGLADRLDIASAATSEAPTWLPSSEATGQRSRQR